MQLERRLLHLPPRRMSAVDFPVPRQPRESKEEEGAPPYLPSVSLANPGKTAHLRLRTHHLLQPPSMNQRQNRQMCDLHPHILDENPSSPGVP